MAARRHRLAEARDDAGRILRVGDEVQHRSEHHGDWLGGVGLLMTLYVVEHLIGPTDVALDEGHLVGGGQQGVDVHLHDRVAVDVDDLGGRVHGVDHLVHAGRGGNPGAEVDDLPDPLLGEEPHRAQRKRAVGPGEQALVRYDHEEQVCDLPAYRAVLLAGQQVVIDPRRTRYGRVDPDRPRPCVAHWSTRPQNAGDAVAARL